MIKGEKNQKLKRGGFIGGKRELKKEGRHRV